MVGHLMLEEARGRKPALESVRVAGLPLLRARVPVRANLRERALEKRLERAALELYRAGTRRVLAPAGFAYWNLLQACGLRAVDPAALCQALAAPLALAELARRGVPPAEATVALRGARVSRPLLQAAEKLCPQVRRLVVSAGREGAGLACYLREEYGVAVLEERAGAPPHVTVDFSPRQDAVPGILRLYSPGLDLAGMTLGARHIPELDAEPMHLLALLWEEDRLPVGDIVLFPAEAGRN